MKDPVSVYRAQKLSAKKSLGQNFLTDVHLARSMAKRAGGNGEGSILEIGPGLGALTKHLLENCAYLVCIERDNHLFGILENCCQEEIQEQRMRLVHGDAMAQDWLELLKAGPQPHVIAGNLPYSITGLLLRRAVELAPSIDCAIFMIQKEVAERLHAQPDTSDYGVLTVFVQAAFSVEIAYQVKRGSFIPQPNVDSAVVVLTPLHPPRAQETPAFAEVVKRAFAQRRKTLRNAWKGMFGWSAQELEQMASEVGISLQARGETLSVEDFDRLAQRAPQPE
jgi:16S rRNA (adenine1518-N6/adenine1519-N6)-dimethyltransferase